MDPLTAGLDYMVQRAHSRREKMIAEIQANRRGEYKVPTWVLGLTLVAIIAAIVLALIFV